MFGYEPVAPEWIERRILWLLKTLPRRDAGFLARRPERPMDPREVYGPLKCDDMDGAIRLLAGRYGIDAGRTRWRYSRELSGCNTIAQVLAQRNGPIEVEILTDLRFESIPLGGALAHELGHAYLTDLDIANGGTWMAEATTDLVTLVCGLGKLTANTVGNLNVGGQAGTPCLGYLNREALLFAYALASEELGVPAADQETGLNSEALGYLRVVRGE